MDKRMVNRMLKPGLIAAGVILACSLVAIGVSQTMPQEKTSQVTLANYSHQGEFSYQAYSTSSLFSGEAVQPAPALFPQIIDELEILFSYSGPKAEEVEMKVILEDGNGNWQKEIPIETTGSSTISFPLDLEEILVLGETINAELKGEDLKEGEELEGEKLSEEELKQRLLKRGSRFLLRIIAEAGTKSSPFVATLEGELSSSALKWKEEGFDKAERGYPGEDDWCQGAFGYKVKLKKNELFGPVSIERKPDLPRAVVVDPDFALFTDLIESVDVGFNYQFDCDAQIDSLSEEVEVEMVVGEAERWKKSFTLVPLTKKQGEFTINLPLDTSKLREMAESIDEQLGGRGGGEQEITISARVHTIAETNFGAIDEVFNHQLKGKMGETIELGAAEEGETGLLLIKEGTITKEITEPNLVFQKLRKSSLIGLRVSLPILCVLAVFYWRRPKPPFLEEELKKNRKKYGELISEVSDFPSIREGEVIISASSLEALVNISNNSLKPILLKVEANKHTYCVIDGLLRYEYISELELPAEEQAQDEHFQT